MMKVTAAAQPVRHEKTVRSSSRTLGVALTLALILSLLALPQAAAADTLSDPAAWRGGIVWEEVNTWDSRDSDGLGEVGTAIMIVRWTFAGDGTSTHPVGTVTPSVSRSYLNTRTSLVWNPTFFRWETCTTVRSESFTQNDVAGGSMQVTYSPYDNGWSAVGFFRVSGTFTSSTERSGSLVCSGSDSNTWEGDWWRRANNGIRQVPLEGSLGDQKLSGRVSRTSEYATGEVVHTTTWNLARGDAEPDPWWDDDNGDDNGGDGSDGDGGNGDGGNGDGSDGDGGGDARLLVALGDSYSSGEGAFRYFDSTDVEGENHCHRSDQSYPYQAFDLLVNEESIRVDEVVSLACSGAETKHIRDTPFCGTGCDTSWPYPPDHQPQIDQLAALAREATVEVVTVGIGGNDAGFSEIVRECISGSNCVEKFDPHPDIGGSLPDDLFEQIGVRVWRVLEQVRQVAPDATIVLVGYPVFIAKPYSGCPPGIGADEAEWLRGQILEFNRELQEVARLASDPDALNPLGDVRYLSLDNVYGSDVLCNGNPESRLINGLAIQGIPPLGDPTEDGCPLAFPPLDELAKNNLLAALSPPLAALIRGANTQVFVCHESFHPKPEGHVRTGDALVACLVDLECGQASTETVAPAPDLVRRGSNPRSRASNPPAGGTDASQGAGQRSAAELRADWPFSDVDPESVHADAISALWATGCIEGFGDETFGPSRAISRAQFASTKACVLDVDLDEQLTSPFDDIAPGATHAAAISSLAEAGLLVGVGNGLFAPEAEVTRGQLTTMIDRKLELPAAEHDPFPDAVGTTHAPAIRAAAAQGIVTGFQDGMFRPQQAVSRAQAASMLVRAFDVE